MKKLILASILTALIQSAAAQSYSSATNTPVMHRPVPQEYYRRFVAADNLNRQNFFWLDSTSGHLWEFDRSLSEWEDHGKEKGMTPGPKGTYMLWPDNRNGVYVLNTDTGKGWWYDGSRWEIIDPADSAKQGNNSIY